MAQAAAITGIPKEFQRWAKSKGCTAFKASRVFIEPLRKFWSENQEEFESVMEESNDGSSAAVNRERVLMLRKQQRKLDRDYEIQTETLISKESVKDRVAKMMGAITGILKKTLSRQDYNAVARQFQECNFDL